LAPEYIKEATKYNKGGYNHPGEEVGLPVKRHSHTCQSCINKEASTSVRHTHLFSGREVSELQLEERERERHIFGGGLSVLA
jgi:hypothetical protein